MELSTDVLVSYVPRFLVRQAATDPGGFPRSGGDRLDGAVLFADLVGFTRLASEFARRGPEGAEQLTAVLNACFGELVERVEAHGGDIVRFPGDAVLAVWPARSKDELERAVQLAARCGLSLQELFGAGGAAVSGLRLRVGIGAGEMLLASVGGADERWECVVAGPPLGQVALAQGVARPGDVVAAPEAWSIISARARGQAGEAGCVRLEAIGDTDALPAPQDPEVPSELAAVLRHYVPRPVLSRLEAGQTEWLAELRRITCLFLRVDGIDYTAGDALERLQDATTAMQSAIYRYDGALNQLVVDDKGTVVLATWGVTLSTHEDDASRAALTALMMQEELVRLGLSGGIGITTGRVFCGRRGNDRRSEYAVIGDVVNLAARLMVAAESGVLCDQETFVAASRQVRFESVPPITVKGHSEPVVVHRPFAERRSASRAEGRVVGRETERSRLADRLDKLRRDGQGGVIVIEGEAGIGKSRLVADLLERARSGRGA